jgi:PhnB protein
VTEQRALPMLAYEDAGRAADWLVRAFGFRELERYRDTRGTVTDVLLERDGARVLVGHPSDAYEGPRHHAESCAQARRWLQTPYIVDGVAVDVDDVDAHYAAAVAAGAKILSPVETNPMQRQYRVEDLEGHRWMFATPAR